MVRLAVIGLARTSKGGTPPPPLGKGGGLVGRLAVNGCAAEFQSLRPEGWSGFYKSIGG